MPSADSQVLDLKAVNLMEVNYLELLQYNVYVSGSLYAKYYFELRTLCEKAERAFSLKPLSEEKQNALVSRANERAEELQAGSRQWKSLGAGLASGSTPMS